MFLGSLQKQGQISSDKDNETEPSTPRVNKDKFKDIIKLVLQIFWRLVSNNVVSGLNCSLLFQQLKDAADDTNQFSESFLGELIYKAYNFDNFLNLIYVYGRSNGSVVQSILNRLSELNPDKFVSQFREEIIATLKKVKNNVRALAVIAKSHYDKSGLTRTEDWPEKIKQYMEDSMSEIKQLYVMAKYFPTIVASSIWPTDVLIILSNFYVLIKEHKPEIWEMYCFEKRWLDKATHDLKKLLFKTIITFIKRQYFGVIGNWGTGFVQKQAELSKAITNFILEMTANQVIHKDSVPSNCSVIEQKGGAHQFLKKILKVVEFEPYLYQLEDRAIPNREL